MVLWGVARHNSVAGWRQGEGRGAPTCCLQVAQWDQWTSALRSNGALAGTAGTQAWPDPAVPPSATSRPFIQCKSHRLLPGRFKTSCLSSAGGLSLEPLDYPCRFTEKVEDRTAASSAYLQFILLMLMALLLRRGDDRSIEWNGPNKF